MASGEKAGITKASEQQRLIAHHSVLRKVLGTPTSEPWAEAHGPPQSQDRGPNGEATRHNVHLSWLRPPGRQRPPPGRRFLSSPSRLPFLRSSPRSADPAQASVIDPNYLADPNDLKVSVEGLKPAREIMAQRALRPYIRNEHMPGESIRTQADCEDFVRQHGRTPYHPAETCRMGGDAEFVDPQLRVRGIDALRAIDSSIMPTLTSSNTFAPPVAIAERGADHLRGS